MPAHSAASESYQTLFKKCLTARAPVERFETYIRKLFSRSPLSPLTISRELVSPSLATHPDPLQLSYIQRLVETNFLSLGEVLDATLRPYGDDEGEESEHGGDDAGSGNGNGNGGESTTTSENPAREAVETSILLMLASNIRFQKPKNPENIWSALSAMGRWMVECTPPPPPPTNASGVYKQSSSTAAALRNSHLQRKKKVRRRGPQCREAVAEVVAALGMDYGVQRVWGNNAGGGAKSRDVRAGFTEALDLFRKALREEGSLLVGRLDGIFVYQRPGGEERDVATRGGTAGGDSAAGNGGGGDTLGKDPSPTVWARSSGVVWISSLLSSRPLTDDDESLLSYLSSRYKDDTETLVSDLILASFDTLATSLNLHNRSTTFLVRSFIVNKLPLLLARIYLPQETLYTILPQVMFKIDPVVMLQGASNDMSSLGDIRQEFLFAMALHGMVEERAIQGFIGELPMMTLPAAGRYSSEDLVKQCTIEPVERIDRLLEELEALDGNAGAVAVAVVEVMRNMCEFKDTMSLKTICSALTRKPSSIDVILLFVKPVYLLEPLCVLLDTWRYDEDQNEYHPVYEEFGYILLLVLATVHRYELPLTSSVLGASSDSVDSFIPRLLTKGMCAQRIEDLESSDRHAQLGGWIKEIFEAEGISDGLMSSCRPQDFYMLVPTLFSQSVIAAGRGVLDVDILKEGFVYLLEPFLMPSLVGALTWMGNHLWEKSASVTGSSSGSGAGARGFGGNGAGGDEAELVIILQILHNLVAPPAALSVEAGMFHQTVLSIVARHLDWMVREVMVGLENAAGGGGGGGGGVPRERSHMMTLGHSILSTLRPHLGFVRSGLAGYQELDMWSNSSLSAAANAAGGGGAGSTGGGIINTLKNHISSLVVFSSAARNGSAGSLSTPVYSPQMVQTALEIYGAGAVAGALVDIATGFQPPDASGGDDGQGAAGLPQTGPGGTVVQIPVPPMPTQAQIETAQLAIDVVTTVMLSPVGLAPGGRIFPPVVSIPGKGDKGSGQSGQQGQVGQMGFGLGMGMGMHNSHQMGQFGQQQLQHQRPLTGAGASGSGGASSGSPTSGGATLSSRITLIDALRSMALESSRSSSRPPKSATTHNSSTNTTTSTNPPTTSTAAVPHTSTPAREKTISLILAKIDSLITPPIWRNSGILPAGTVRAIINHNHGQNLQGGNQSNNHNNPNNGQDDFSSLGMGMSMGMDMMMGGGGNAGGGGGNGGNNNMGGMGNMGMGNMGMGNMGMGNMGMGGMGGGAGGGGLMDLDFGNEGDINLLDEFVANGMDLG